MNLIFWEVQNTGWSGGTSWFTCGNKDPYRFDSAADAMAYFIKHRDPNQDTIWRIVQVRIERHGNDDTGGEHIKRDWMVVK